MIEVMIAVLVLFIVQTFLPPAIQYLGADGSSASGAGNGRSRGGRWIT